jgi:NADH-quinone oxidoreductase subunit L
MAANVGLLANNTVELPTWLSFLPGFPNMPLLTLACLCLFVGACGKSAQIPLYVWLPDAMAGPTPVSALIHAATMVTAGVYMVSRMSFAFSLAPGAQAAVAWTGALTAFFAATIAVAQTDIKKVLAYSTVSQLGYMFLAAGVAAYSAAIFHEMTHAFFKALLFLGAGSVILGMHHEQDITKMGGLRRRMPVTWLTFLVGVIAISGVPPFSGFFSKDEILLAAYQADSIPGHHTLWLIGMTTAFMTAFYMFRLYFLVFTGTSRASHHTQEHIHESGNWVLVPLVVLALFSVIGGFFGLPDAYGELFGVQRSNSLHHFLQPVVHSPEHEIDRATEFGLAALTTAVGFAGIALATLLYYWRKDLVPGIVSATGPLYRLVRDKYRIDELYDFAIVRPLGAISRGLLARGIDQGLIDGIGVNGTANFVRATADGALKYLQTGLAQSYIFAMVIGGVLLVAWLVRGT